jgi:hypothetical protein
MGLATELMIREVLILGLHELAGDETRFRQLVGRSDALQDGSQGDWPGELLTVFRLLLDSSSDDYLQFKVGYPAEAGELPCVSIVKEAGAEDAGLAQAGDVLDIGYHQTGVYTYLSPAGLPREAPRLEEHTQLGTGWTTTTQIGSWATSLELAMLLDAAVHNVLFRDKLRLFVAGVHDVGFSEGGTPTDNTVQANLRVGYVPMQRVTLEWTRVQTHRSPAPNRVRIMPVEPQ